MEAAEAKIQRVLEGSNQFLVPHYQPPWSRTPMRTRRARRCRALAAFASMVSLAPCRALAQEPVEPIRLTYRASHGCPNEAEFVARVRARTARVRPAGPREAARTFDVAVDAGPLARGRVTIIQDDQPVGTRSVQGDTCSEVVDAIALVVALAIDPRASPPRDSPGPALQPALSESSPSVSLPDPSPNPTAALPRAVPPIRPPSTLPEIAPPRNQRTSEPIHDAVATDTTHARPAASHHAFAGADFAVAAGVAPSALLAGVPFVGWRANRSTWFDPSLRLAFFRAGTGAFDVQAGGTATFTITVGRLDACPVAFTHASRVRATVCARVEAGALDAAGGGIAAAQSSLRPWFAAGPLARAEWSLVPPFFLDLEAGALFRIVADRYGFYPDVTVYNVPVVGLGAGAGLGVDFL